MASQDSGELDTTNPDIFLALHLDMRSEIADLMANGSHWLEVIEEHADTRKARQQIHEGLTQAVMVQSSLDDNIIQDTVNDQTTMSSVQRKSKLDAARLSFNTLRATFNELRTLPEVIIVEDQRSGAQPSSSSGASAAAPDPASLSGTPASKRARLSNDVVVEIDD